MKFSLKPHIRIEQSPEKIVMIDDLNGDFYECNETALFMIKSLFKSVSRDSLVDLLLENYEIEKSDAYMQVDHCIGTLSVIGVLNEESA